MSSVHPVPSAQQNRVRTHGASRGRRRATIKPTPDDATDQRPPHEQPRMPDDSTVERMVAEAAYYLAEKRNFEPGYEEADWLAAKAQIAEQFRQALNPLGRKAPQEQAHDTPRSARRRPRRTATRT